MKQQYKETRRKIEALCLKWTALMDLPGYRLTHVFTETEDGPTLAITAAQWEYRCGLMTWYLPALVSLDDETLELTVIHELCHLLNAPIRKRGKSLRYELATENMARALWQTFNKGL